MGSKSKERVDFWKIILASYIASIKDKDFKIFTADG